MITLGVLRLAEDSVRVCRRSWTLRIALLLGLIWLCRPPCMPRAGAPDGWGQVLSLACDSEGDVAAPVALGLQEQRLASRRSYALDSTIRLLQALRSRNDLPPYLDNLVHSGKLGVLVRFRDGVHLQHLSQLEAQLGIEFTRVNGKVASVGGVRGAQTPWESLDRLAEWPGVVRVDSIWKPAVAAPLDVSIVETGADKIWNLLDSEGWYVRGRGVVVAAFDTGIDVFHPDFWRADGGTYPWLDVNDNNVFDPGTDAVDLDRSGSISANELLDAIDATSSWSDAIPGTNDSTFQANMDWLYNDANRNGLRDYGPPDFAETDATYGERLYMTEDGNQNGILDPEEVLLALGSSKVYKTLDVNAVERSSGLDLIHDPPDGDGHGTSVGSVLCGGSVGTRRYVGVAPEMSLLMANRFVHSGDPTIYMQWAEANGAQVMLYEFGSWIQEFLDGSSNLEQMVDAEAAKGIVQIAPAGNLADGKKHAHRIMGGGASDDTPVTVPWGWEIADAWLSILWHGPEDALDVLQITTPSGVSVTPPGDGSWVETTDGHSVLSERDQSARGTSRFDVYVYGKGADVADGTWHLSLHNNTMSWLSVHVYVYDSITAWTDGVTFPDGVAFSGSTVTSPATADNAIAVASYSTRGHNDLVSGALSPFSGRGPRIDGQSVLDMAAPGHYDIACALSGDATDAAFGQYSWFGGTSAAAAHVAGAAALLLQSDPSLSPAQVRQRLRDAARRDDHTGVVPNDSWGLGKLDVWAALPVIPTVTPTPRSRALLPVVLKMAFP